MELKGDVSVLTLSLFSKLLWSFKKCLKVYSHDLRVSVDPSTHFVRFRTSSCMKWIESDCPKIQGSLSSYPHQTGGFHPQLGFTLSLPKGLTLVLIIHQTIWAAEMISKHKEEVNYFVLVYFFLFCNTSMLRIKPIPIRVEERREEIISK